MEDPSLLEESSNLLEPKEAGRVAPLRLGWVCQWVLVSLFYWVILNAQLKH